MEQSSNLHFEPLTLLPETRNFFDTQTTGAFTSIVPEKKIRKFKYTNSVKSFEKIYKNSTESYLVWTKLNFANQTLTNSLLYSRTGISDCSIGTNILENFDFYASTKDGYGILCFTNRE